MRDLYDKHLRTPRAHSTTVTHLPPRPARLQGPDRKQAARANRKLTWSRSGGGGLQGTVQGPDERDGEGTAPRTHEEGVSHMVGSVRGVHLGRRRVPCPPPPLPAAAPWPRVAVLKGSQRAPGADTWRWPPGWVPERADRWGHPDSGPTGERPQLSHVKRVRDEREVPPPST